MTVRKKRSFSISIFLLLLPYVIYDAHANEVSNDVKTRNQNEYVDPHSFYYNKHTKTEMRMATRRSGDEHSDNAVVQFSPYQECNRLFNECVNNKMRDIPDELFSRRIVNLLLSVASFESIDDSLTSNIVMEVTPSQLKKLKNFGLGETSIRDIDSMLPKIFRAPEKYIFQDTFSFIKHLFVEAFMHKDIVLGSLFVCWMTWVILTTKWNMLKLITIMMMVILAASFVITWLQLLKEAEIQHTVKQMLYTDLPTYCQPSKRTWLDSIWMMFGTPDSCQKHYEAVMENPFLQVTPAQALSHMIGTCILQPAKSIGDALSDFTHHSTKYLPYPFRVIVELLLMIAIPVITILAMICMAGGSLGWGLGPLKLLTVTGRSRSANNTSMINAERRDPIEVILNLKVTQQGGTHQFAIETPKQANNATVTLLENEGISYESVNDSNSTPKSKQLDLARRSPIEELHKCESRMSDAEELNINPASGDSNLLNAPLACDKCKDTNETNLEESVAESGSGDN